MKRSDAGLAFFVCVLISTLLAGCGSNGSSAPVAVPDNVIRNTQFGAAWGPVRGPASGCAALEGSGRSHSVE